MGMTATEKIVARAAHRDRVHPDEILWVDVDLAMMHDSSGPRRIWPALTRHGQQVSTGAPLTEFCDLLVLRPFS